MIITYLRSSSYNNWEFCEMQYFMDYVLGLPQKSNQKADKGTIVHKILEVMADIKTELQVNSGRTILSYAFGDVEFDDSYIEQTALTNEDVDRINKTRINKSTYMSPCKLEYGHTRRGILLVEDVIRKVHDYYTKKWDHHSWKPVDFKDITNFTWMAMDYMNGLFDPRLRKIVQSEQHFDMEIDRPWADFLYEVDGEEISGKLAIKGTIDLLTEPKDGIIEVIDWKTGQRINWAKKNTPIKTAEDFLYDPQLMLYYYAIRRLYPKIKSVILTIFYIRHGGPFSVCMDDEHFAKMEHLLRKRFEEIRANQMPKMISPRQTDFKCKYICHYGKNDWEDTGCNQCKFINNELKSKGIDEVVELYKNENHEIDGYSAPG